ncbi:hypothetical protein AcW1_009807 [Taiwanofungus camphoratus]|nr:hypothetical protein AcW1_009807 [Antrodia cinnamomea]
MMSSSSSVVDPPVLPLPLISTADLVQAITQYAASTPCTTQTQIPVASTSFVVCQTSGLSRSCSNDTYPSLFATQSCLPVSHDTAPWIATIVLGCVLGAILVLLLLVFFIVVYRQSRRVEADINIITHKFVDVEAGLSLPATPTQATLLEMPTSQQQTQARHSFLVSPPSSDNSASPSSEAQSRSPPAYSYMQSPEIQPRHIHERCCMLSSSNTSLPSENEIPFDQPIMNGRVSEQEDDTVWQIADPPPAYMDGQFRFSVNSRYSLM